MVSAAGGFDRSNSFLPSSLETSSKEESKDPDTEKSPNMQIVPSIKPHFTKAEFITKYVMSFDEFLDHIKYVFPKSCHNEDENKRRYEIYCNNCYNAYLRNKFLRQMIQEC